MSPMFIKYVYSNCLGVSDEPAFYPRVLSLCRALSQYLLSLSQLPSSLQIPSDKEDLISTFTCTATEVKDEFSL